MVHIRWCGYLVVGSIVLPGTRAGSFCRLQSGTRSHADQRHTLFVLTSGGDDRDTRRLTLTFLSRQLAQPLEGGPQYTILGSGSRQSLCPSRENIIARSKYVWPLPRQGGSCTVKAVNEPVAKTSQCESTKSGGGARRPQTGCRRSSVSPARWVPP